MARWIKLARNVKRMLDRRLPPPQGWYRALGRPLSAAEVDALHRVVWPCPGYIVAVGRNAGPDHPLWGWWEGPRGEYSRRPYLDAVWDLAVASELKRHTRSIKASTLPGSPLAAIALTVMLAACGGSSSTSPKPDAATCATEVATIPCATCSCDEAWPPGCGYGCTCSGCDVAVEVHCEVVEQFDETVRYCCEPELAPACALPRTRW